MSRLALPEPPTVILANAAEELALRGGEIGGIRALELALGFHYRDRGLFDARVARVGRGFTEVLLTEYASAIREDDALRNRGGRLPARVVDYRARLSEVLADVVQLHPREGVA